MLPQRRINYVLNRAILASPFFLFPLFLLNFPEQLDTSVTYTYRSRAWRNEATTSGEPVKTIPIIYAITATYSRPTQIAEMTRLAQTLMHVSKLLWIVVEQGTERSRSLNNLLRKSGISFVHLTAQENPTAIQVCYPKKPFGSVHSRYAALEWIRQHAESDGVVYMLDDDNCYDLKLFEEMRFTKKVSMWPVGLVGKYGISSPVIKNGKLIGFHDFRMKYRRFPVDYASFAVSVSLIREKQNINLGCQKGSNEDSYLNSLDLSLDDLEPKADNCTKVATILKMASKQSQSNVKIASGAVICKDCELKGDITIGSRTIIHPTARIIAEAGPIIIGENNLVEEQVQIFNRTSTGGSDESTPVLTVGNNNVFEVGSSSLKIGDNNILESKAKLGRHVELTSGCVIGAMCEITTKEVIPENTVIFGKKCERRIQAEKPTPQTLQLDFLTKVLPNYHHLRKPTKVESRQS
ncbi:uncharacterized protein LOC143244745 isoform X2 [Tachypleus tridentatus]|uniref:uncharacterized protein LOC143244745 isoform X2 n=1 Tax=Tachypleus tridentatus TaxID=6853 RepID=UPI003FD1934F